jgi:hypothetical protein
LFEPFARLLLHAQSGWQKGQAGKHFLPFIIVSCQVCYNSATMSDESPKENNFLRLIVNIVEDLRDRMATKDDLAQMATKDDLAQMATKDDLESLREQVDYIGGQLETMRDQMATKGDLAQMATKNDLAQLEARFVAKLQAETTAIRGDIEQVHMRLDSIQHALTARLSQLETEMSRLRSVVYLLVKDRPELLRLLGQEPPPS